MALNGKKKNKSDCKSVSQPISGNLATNIKAEKELYYNTLAMKAKLKHRYATLTSACPEVAELSYILFFVYINSKFKVFLQHMSSFGSTVCRTVVVCSN